MNTFMKFECSLCHGVFNKLNNEDWNSFKSAEEFLMLYPECKNDRTDIVCDDCYKEFKKWFATLTEEDKRKIREKFENE
jgi:hypothetical protein